MKKCDWLATIELVKHAWILICKLLKIWESIQSKSGHTLEGVGESKKHAKILFDSDFPN